MGQKKLESQEAGNTFPGDLFTLFENPIARSFGRQYLLHFFFIPLQFDEGSPWPSGECPGELSIYCEEGKEPGGETFLSFLFFLFPSGVSFQGGTHSLSDGKKGPSPFPLLFKETSGKSECV